MLDRFRRALLIPHRYLAFERRFDGRPFRLLDVGAGNHSASITHRWFPRCRYSGIDRDRTYQNDERDFAVMEEFFELDLTGLGFAAIPDASYDALLLAHVLEHLENAPDVLRALVPKLRPGGILYAEFPGPQSLQMPSRRGTLNFHDDPTHVRPWSAGEIAAVLVDAGCRVRRQGTRRDPRGIALLPLHAWKARRLYGFVPGGVFWDLYGFADYVEAERPPDGVDTHQSAH